MPTTQNSDLINTKYQELLDACKAFLNKNNESKIQKAYEFAIKDFSKNKEKFLTESVPHPCEVAIIVAKEIGQGETSVISALLHRSIQDNQEIISFFEREFGKSVVSILIGINKTSNIWTDKISFNAENFRKLFLSLADDIRVVLIKLAHCLYDMRNYESLTKEFKEQILSEVEFFYIPISHQLGFYNIKTELDELLMKYTIPKLYKSIESKIIESQSEQDRFILDFTLPIQRELLMYSYECDIKGRSKSIPSIYQKMQKKQLDFDEVFDLFAIRIIVESKKKNEKSDCWRIYSIVTNIYKPNPKRLRDWISQPKPNGYESLQITVEGPRGKWVEVQIRTKRMDEKAEKGIAAHWKYKNVLNIKSSEERLASFREILENPQEKAKTENLLESKTLHESDKIFVYTPRGDLKKLPLGSTVLDFAFEIHTIIGSKCKGGKVNGKITPIKRILQNGDRVEVITSNNQFPKLDWLNIVVTNKAISRIKRSLNEERFKEAKTGNEILRRKLRNWKLKFNDETIDKLVKHYKLSSSVDLYYKIAIEEIDILEVKKILIGTFDTSIKPDKTEEIFIDKELQLKSETYDDILLLDENLKNVTYTFAKCCNPIRGDKVFGFVAIGKGITIHRKNCPNARHLFDNYKYRIRKIKWRQTEGMKLFQALIKIVGVDKQGIMNEVLKIISDDIKLNITSLSVDSKADALFEGKVGINVTNSKMLATIINRIQKIEGVIKVSRISKLE